MRTLYIGIDNGSSGGIGVVADGGTLYRADPMPATDIELLTILQTLAVPDYSVVAFAGLEYAQAFPKMGRSGAFNYGRGYGAMQMALTAAGIAFDIITPRRWQAAMSCLTGGDKNVSKRRAEQLFPGYKITHAIADALLIAEYCRRMRVAHGEKENRAQQTSEARQGEGSVARRVSPNFFESAQRVEDERKREARPRRRKGSA